MAYKGNNHKVGRNGAIGGYRVELAGLVENNAPFFQGVAMAACSDRHFPFIHAEEFPEVMGFSFKYEIFPIFKIMDCDNLRDIK